MACLEGTVVAVLKPAAAAVAESVVVAAAAVGMYQWAV